MGTETQDTGKRSLTFITLHVICIIVITRHACFTPYLSFSSLLTQAGRVTSVIETQTRPSQKFTVLKEKHHPLNTTNISTSLLLYRKGYNTL